MFEKNDISESDGMCNVYIIKPPGDVANLNEEKNDADWGTPAAGDIAKGSVVIVTNE